jgi:hypothetical protein
MGGFVYPWFFGVIERVGVRFCSDVDNDGYRNVSALLSKLLSKKGNEGASDQVCMVLGFGDFALITWGVSMLFKRLKKRTGIDGK